MSKVTRRRISSQVSAAWPPALRLAGWPDDRAVWTGSCPCQPFSNAGKRRGTADERHLWPDWFRLIRERRPVAVFGEQVDSAIRAGWLDGVFADLEGEGYACGAAVLGAHSVGAPHIRQRLWWVADSDGRLAGNHRIQRGGEHGQQPQDGGAGDGLEHTTSDGRQQGRAESIGRSIASGCSTGRLGDTTSHDQRRDSMPGIDRERFAAGRPSGPGTHTPERLGDSEQPRLEGYAGHEHNGNQPRRDGADENGSVAEASGDGPWSRCDLIHCRDGKARRIEPGLTPLAHGVSGRVAKLRGFGNAIVPQVAKEFIQACCEALSLAAHD